NSATALSRGEPGCRPGASGCGTRFNSATALSRGEPRTRPSGSGPRPGFNSATALSRGEQPLDEQGGGRVDCFNSATALSRGERTELVPPRFGVLALQFGHGVEPWRTRLVREALTEAFDASIRPRR